MPSIYAIGRNYVAHIEELQNDVPDQMVWFLKSNGCLTSENSLQFPDNLGPIHFELEVVLKIAKNIPMGSKFEPTWVSSMTLGIDFTARETQFELKKKGLPWDRAKSFNHSAFVGKWVEPVWDQGITFQLKRGTDVLQEGHTDLMLFSFQDILQGINKNLPLVEGDLVFTGTPSGVGPCLQPDQLRFGSPELAIEGEVKVAF